MLGAVVQRAAPRSWMEIAPGSAHPLRFRPILLALREPTNASLDVFPRELFINTQEREGVNFGVKYSCAAGLLLGTLHRKSAVRVGNPR